MPSQKPSPGSIVRVTTKYKSHYYLATDPYAYNTYEGVVTPSEKWYSPTDFGLRTAARLHIINTNNVSELVILEGDSATVNLPRSITVMGSKGNVYEVAEQGGVVQCTCPAFTYRKSCKHLAELST